VAQSTAHPKVMTSRSARIARNQQVAIRGRESLEGCDANAAFEAVVKSPRRDDHDLIFDLLPTEDTLPAEESRDDKLPWPQVPINWQVALPTPPFRTNPVKWLQDWCVSPHSPCW
jgi:hypothetical protein